MIKFGKKCIISLIAFITLILLSFIFFFYELRTLATLNQVDDHPLYRMRYYGDYKFDEFLKTGAKSDKDIIRFISMNLLKGIPFALGDMGGGCTAFVTRNEKGEVIYGRNFDFSYTPAFQVITEPKNGYKSISTVNLIYAGYSENNLPKKFSLNSLQTLAAPYLPFDGINEKGVAIALLSVPKSDVPFSVDKVTLNTTTAIRLVLDMAANVDEAIDLLKQYNIFFSGNIKCHYLIADASNKSVLIEYWDGKMQTITVPEQYQIASNFIAYNGLNIGYGGDEFDRYNKVDNKIKENNGILTEEQAVELLSEIGTYDENGNNRLQWTVIYNLSNLKGKIFAGRNKNNIISFALDDY